MQKLARGTVTRFAFDYHDPLMLEVEQGEAFQIETEDALSGMIADDSDSPTVHRMVDDPHVSKLLEAYPPNFNLVVGPIHVRGCAAGDVLAVTIDVVDPWRYGFTGIIPGYLNAYREGGLLYVGDVHGGQGDTEFTALADETRALVQLTCHVIKNKRLPCVRIDKPGSIVAVDINLPLEHAVYDACDNMMEWLRDDYGISGKDSYLRMSADPAFRVRVYQMVRAMTARHVAGAEYPKDRLFPAW